MKEMSIELIVGDGNPLTNAAVPVRWCISQSVLQKIKDEEGEYDAQVLVIAVDERGHESRMLAPLSQGMGYVNLNRAGINKLYSMIIYNVIDDNETNSSRFIKNVFLSKEGRFEYSKMLKITDSGVSQYYQSREYTTIDGTEGIEVDIPKELFGKEPPEWFKGLVNTWQDTHLDDQCAWRRRLMFFVGVKMWAMLIVTALVWCFNSLITAVFVLIGTKPHKLDYRWVKHPLVIHGTESPSIEHSVLYKDGKFNIWRIPLAPGVSLLIGASLMFIGVDLLIGIVYLLGILLLVPVFVLAMMKISQSIDFVVNNINIKGINNISSNINDKIKQRRNRLIIRDRAIAAETYNHSEDYLSCKLCDKVASVALVPRQNMTIRLRYEQIKNAVCKPMMR